MSSHGGAVAEGSPYLGSIFPVVMLQSTRPGPATHRLAAPISQARARANRSVSMRAKDYQHSRRAEAADRGLPVSRRTARCR